MTCNVGNVSSSSYLRQGNQCFPCQGGGQYTWRRCSCKNLHAKISRYPASLRQISDKGSLFFFFLFASQLVPYGSYHKRLCLVSLAIRYIARCTQPALWRSACWGQNDWDLYSQSSSNGIRQPNLSCNSVCPFSHNFPSLSLRSFV